MTKKKSKATEHTAVQNIAIQARVAEVTVDSALKSVSAAQAQIGKTLASVGEQLQRELQILDDVKKAVTLEKAELEALHGKESLLSSIDELQLQFDTKTLELQERFNTVSRALEDKQDEIARHNAAEAANFDLENTKAKLEAQANLETEIHAARIAERDRKELLLKDWMAREETLKKSETEFIELKAKVEAFPALLKAEAGKAQGMAESGIKREYEHTLALTRKDAETAKQMADLQVTTLRQQNVELTKQLNDAYTKLDAANAKVSSIAEKALESASGQRTLTEMQSFAQGAKENGAAPRKT